LVLLLFAVQVIFDLYARSVVTSAAVEAARAVADFGSAQFYGAAPDGGFNAAEQDAINSAQLRAEEALGSYSHATDFDWKLLGPDGRPDPSDPTEVELTVSFDLSGTGYDLARPLALPGLNRFDRTIRVRIEHVVCPADASCSIVTAPTVGGAGP